VTSPVIDAEAICDALAARFIAATLGTPAGETAMRKSYSETPKAVPALPAHLLEVQDGELVASPGGVWDHQWRIDGLLLLAKRPGDPARVETSRRKWLPYLLHATVDQLKISKGGQSGYSVDKAIPTAWEFTEFEVGDVEYDAIRVRWVVWIKETVSITP
jgi:hypothetical protein